ncbi:hypothetical protein PIB30_111539, partial [Stylosanthes scabra]|nr:hypothetical protein [Stylosanthes scabra]
THFCFPGNSAKNLTAGPRLVRKSGVSLQISPDRCQGNRAKFSLRKGVTEVQPSLKIPSTGLGSFSLGSRNRGLSLIEKISGLVAVVVENRAQENRLKQ